MGFVMNVKIEDDKIEDSSFGFLLSYQNKNREVTKMTPENLCSIFAIYRDFNFEIKISEPTSSDFK